MTPVHIPRSVLSRFLRWVADELDDGTISALSINLDPTGYSRFAGVGLHGLAPVIPEFMTDPDTDTPPESPSAKARFDDPEEPKV